VRSIEEIKRDNAPKPKRTKATGVSGRARSKRVRGAARRQSTSLVVRRLNTEALVAIGYDRPQAEKLSTPTLAVHFGLVGHGYEIHVFDEGKYIGAGCRDFSDTHKVEDLKVSLMEAIEDAVAKWRKRL
jgi:hypothetical protein